jgi:hypothetical protein
MISGKHKIRDIEVEVAQGPISNKSDINNFEKIVYISVHKYVYRYVHIYMFKRRKIY